MAPTRIVLTGAECTGKTTLAAELGARFHAPWVAEAARLYAERSPVPLSAATVEPIARLSLELQAEALATDPTLLFLDTDLISTVIYARHYYGSCPAWIESEARDRRADLYLLGMPDLPWVADGVRDRPADRERMFARFAETLDEFGARVEVIRGQGTARTAMAARAVEALLGGAAR